LEGIGGGATLEGRRGGWKKKKVVQDLNRKMVGKGKRDYRKQSNNSQQSTAGKKKIMKAGTGGGGTLCGRDMGVTHLPFDRLMGTRTRTAENKQVQSRESKNI